MDCSCLVTWMFFVAAKKVLQMFSELSISATDHKESREKGRGCAWMRQPSSESFCSSFHQVNYFSTPGSVPVRSWKPGPWMGQLACMHHQRPSTRSRLRKKKDALISSPACGVMKTSLIKTLPLTEPHFSVYLLFASEHVATLACVCVLHYFACACCLNQLLLAC